MSPRTLTRYPFTLICLAMLLFLSLFNPPSDGPQLALGVDKLVHFGMYFGTCATLWWEYVRRHRRLDVRRMGLCAVVLPVALGGALELVQEFATTWRGGDWADFLANSLGVLAAALLGRCFLWPLYRD